MVSTLSIVLHNCNNWLLFKKFCSRYIIYLSPTMANYIQLSSFELIEQVDEYSEI
jgi:hypothetical protein